MTTETPDTNGTQPDAATEGRGEAPPGDEGPPKRPSAVSATAIVFVVLGALALGGLRKVASWGEEEATRVHRDARIIGSPGGDLGRMLRESSDLQHEYGYTMQVSARRIRAFSWIAPGLMLGYALFMQLQKRRKVRGARTLPWTLTASIGLPCLIAGGYVLVLTQIKGLPGEDPADSNCPAFCTRYLECDWHDARSPESMSAHERYSEATYCAETCDEFSAEGRAQADGCADAPDCESFFDCWTDVPQGDPSRTPCPEFCTREIECRREVRDGLRMGFSGLDHKEIVESCEELCSADEARRAANDCASAPDCAAFDRCSRGIPMDRY